MANERDDRTRDVEAALSRLLACPDPDPAFLSRLEARLAEREAGPSRFPRLGPLLPTEVWHRLSEWVGAAAAAPGRLATGLLWAATVVALVAVLWTRASSLRQGPVLPVSAVATPTLAATAILGLSPLPTPPHGFDSPFATATPSPQPLGLVAQTISESFLGDGVIAYLREGDVRLVDAGTLATAQLTVSGNVAYIFGWSYDRTKLLVGVGEHPVIPESDMPRGTDLWVLDLLRGGVTQLTQGLEVHPIYGVAWSPVSYQIAYVTRGWDLYLVDSDRGNRRLLLEKHAAGWPSWSPDGSELALSKLKDPTDWTVTDIAVIRLDDGSVRELTSEATNAYPVWSLDGREILFQSSMAKPEGTGTWHLAKADGSALRHLPESPPSVASNATRSPYADQVAYDLYGEVLVMDFEGHVRRVAEGTRPAWSPDGRRIAFVGTDGGLFTVNADGTGLTRLATEGTEPCWAYHQEPRGEKADAEEVSGPAPAQDFGDFPRTAFIARAPGTSYLAVYLAKGNSVTQVRALGRTNWGSTSHSSELSPDGRHLATRFVDGELGGTYIQVFDLETGDQQLVADSAIRMRPVTADEPRGYEEITSVAWLDDDHVLYTRVSWLHAASVTGEVWVSDLRGEDQSLLGAGSIYRVVGASPDGKAIYVTRLIPGMWEYREEGLALLDVTSGEVRNLWPAEDVGSEVHHAFDLVSLPDGSRRISFVTMQRANTMVTEPPRIWLGDPLTGEAEAVWTVTESVPRNGYSMYNIPAQIAWSPDSPRRFAYLGGCSVLGGLWRVDAEAGESMLLAETDPPDCTPLSLLPWAPEGIVALEKEEGVLRLLSEAGEELGRLTLRSPTSMP